MTDALTARQRRTAAQQVETSRLLGVDFVPAGVPAPQPGASPARAGTAPAPVGKGPAVSVEPAAPVPGRRDRAAVEADLDNILRRYIADAPHAPFVREFTNIVFGDGDPCARLMFVGEAPGQEEDLTGRPFVGRAGQLLNKMITAMGLSRETVYIANVLKVRPPNNATPTLEEAEASKPYLLDQIRVIDPEVIVALGKPATQTLLGVGDSMASLRGRWASLRVGSRDIPVMPTYHPAYLLRAYTDENRRKVWSDLRQVMVRLGLASAGDSPAQ